MNLSGALEFDAYPARMAEWALGKIRE